MLKIIAEIILFVAGLCFIICLWRWGVLDESYGRKKAIQRLVMTGLLF